jgi:hypothetical protein
LIDLLIWLREFPITRGFADLADPKKILDLHKMDCDRRSYQALRQRLGKPIDGHDEDGVEPEPINDPNFVSLIDALSQVFAVIFGHDPPDFGLVHG